MKKILKSGLLIGKSNCHPTLNPTFQTVFCDYEFYLLLLQKFCKILRDVFILKNSLLHNNSSCYQGSCKTQIYTIEMITESQYKHHIILKFIRTSDIHQYIILLILVSDTF